MKIQDKSELKNYSLTRPPAFPALWTIVLDELLPRFVKDRFSPKESWKTKPFSQTDVAFFSTGLLELSDFFTEDREGAKLPNYFTTARFRSSYFLYFFALQGAKFLTLFDRYPKAVEAAFAHAKKTGTLKIVDVGSGPGTASIAFLIFVLERFKKERKLPFAVHLHWIDYNSTILKDGELLLNAILSTFSDFDGDIRLTTEDRAWWKHPRDFDFDASLVLFGNVLNETQKDPRIFIQGLAPFLKDPKGAGVLILEPAFRSASQRVAQIRDEVMPHPIWGPCLHTEKCPLADGRDWCHFSVPATLPGTFFKRFSIKLGGVRDWLKFSFVWFAAKTSEKDAVSADLFPIVRVVSDPLKTKDGMKNQLCRPTQIGWVDTPSRSMNEATHAGLHSSRQGALHRGDAIVYSKTQSDQRPGRSHDSVFQPKNKKARDGKSFRNNVRRPRVQK